MTPAIDYSLIKKAIQYYTDNGYSYIQVPWIISSEAFNITMPVDVKLSESEQNFVASGEQSFLEIRHQLIKGRFCCKTPCFRPQDKNKSPYHFDQFTKVELIYVDTKESDHLIYRIELSKMIMSALSFFELYTRCRVLEITDTPRHNCYDKISFDIYVNDIEIGSYGIRHSDKYNRTWVYGTGLALPRFTQLITKDIK